MESSSAIRGSLSGLPLGITQTIFKLVISGEEGLLLFQRDLEGGGRTMLRFRLICRKWNETVVSTLRIIIGKNFFKNHEGMSQVSSEVIALREHFHQILFKCKLHIE